MPLDLKETEANDAKGGKRKLGGKKGVMSESPAGAGLGDGSMLAFRFRAKPKHSTPEDEDEDEDDEMDIEDDQGWNVVLPSYDDEE